MRAFVFGLLAAALLMWALGWPSGLRSGAPVDPVNAAALDGVMESGSPATPPPSMPAVGSSGPATPVLVMDELLAGIARRESAAIARGFA